MSTSMTLVDPTGKDIAVRKVGHVPERVAKMRGQLAQELGKMRQAWAQDNAQDPTGATTPNAAAIDLHYTEQWRQRARAAAMSAEPVEVDPEAMATWIADQRQRHARQQDLVRPLQQVRELEPFGFKLVGVGSLGTVWLNDHVALCVDGDGLTHIALKPHWCAVYDWACRRWLGAKAWTTEHCFSDYTLGELFSLLQALRITKTATLPEPCMDMARGTDTPVE